MFPDNNLLTEPFVSVIIPCYGECPYLPECLDALERQTFPHDRFEVVLVDNGMNVPAHNIIGNRRVAFTIVTEEIPGSYAARNKGILSAKGDILAFTDSDCIPDADWLRLGVDRLQRTPNCGLVAGKFVFSFKSNNKPNLIELYDNLMHLQQDQYVTNLRYGATGNMLTSKTIFEQIGMFDQSLFSGGDAEWGQRVHSCGYPQIYADEVRVIHPARNNMKQYLNKLRRLAGGEFKRQRLRGRSFFRLAASQLKSHFNKIVSIIKDNTIDNLYIKSCLVLLVIYLLFIRLLEYLLILIGKSTVR